MLTSTPNYLTKSSVCWISTHHYAQVGFAVGSTTTTSCQTKHVARSNSIEDVNGDIDGLVYSRTDRPTTQLACQILKSAPTPADRVRSDWNGAVVASVSPQLPVTVCQAWQPPVTSSQPQRRRPSRIRTGTHRVCRLLQSSG